MNALILAVVLVGTSTDPLPGAEPGVTVRGKVSCTFGAKQKRKRRVLEKYLGPGMQHHRDADASPAVVYLEPVDGSSPPPREPASSEASKASVAKPPVTIRQEGLEFRPRVMLVRRGTSVAFPNEDPIFHQVFSYSKSKRFDLGRYAPGQSKSVKFDKAGLVKVRCDIHEHMRAFIHVLDHPYFALADADGSYSIPDVPPGKYKLVIWKEFFDFERKTIEVADADARFDVKLSLRTEGETDRMVARGTPPRIEWRVPECCER